MDVHIHENHFSTKGISLDSYDNSKEIRNRAQFIFTIMARNCRISARSTTLLVIALVMCGLYALSTIQRYHNQGGFNLRSGSIMQVGYNATQESLSPVRFLHNVPALEGGGYDLNHLIVVAGHAITVVEDLSHVQSTDDAWYLLPYQRDQGIPQELVSHIQTGVDAASKDPKSLLVFSGGQTRVQAGPKSEASAYYFVADHFRWWGKEAVRARAVTEEYALDSFLNLLYSICRFREVAGHYPSIITVVSYSFKKKRFSQIHRSALRFPPQQFHFIGVVPKDTRFDLKEAADGENQNALTPYITDPYGCHTDVLQGKRGERNPYRRFPPYRLSCPEIKGLLEWCGPELYSYSTLPWLLPKPKNESLAFLSSH
mmetsp:Transcript_37478/g.49388  ORF Transcript_37478/g.49388 Transcript_37478/m.49388 type:complete len:371 (-) Transcript_37478:270-1382(-)